MRRSRRGRARPAIITALSRIRWLFVIARNSSFTYKGQPVDVKQVGRELGVRYVLEGSVRKAAGRVRITAQLIEAETGAHLWADRFDGSLEEIFHLQDQVAASVSGVIEPALQAAEIRYSAKRRMTDLTAYDLYVRARLPYRYLAACYARMGRLDEARDVVKRLRTHGRAAGQEHRPAGARPPHPHRRRRRAAGRHAAANARPGFALGSTTGVRDASRLMISRASSSRPICA